MRCPYLSIVFFGSMVVLSGCGPSVSKVEGIVTWKGLPVEGATVTLIPDGNEGDSLLPVGFTDSNGHFSLKSGNLEGAKYGKYKILVSKIENIADSFGEAGKDDPTKAMEKYNKMTPKTEASKMPPGSKSMPGGAMKMMMGAKMPGMAVAPKQNHLLPEKYAKSDTTTLKVEVPVKEPLQLVLEGEAPKTKK